MYINTMIDKTREVQTLIFMNIRFHKRQHKRNVRCEDDSLSRPRNKGNDRNVMILISLSLKHMQYLVIVDIPLVVLE